jgi:hypothetical protein
MKRERSSNRLNGDEDKLGRREHSCMIEGARKAIGGLH